jgi:hypothetical protein
VCIQSVTGEKVNILGGHSIGYSKQKLYMYMCTIPNYFRDRDISLYSSKIVDKKEILRTVSNTGIYCSSLPSIMHFRKFTHNNNALCNCSEDMTCCSSGIAYLGNLSEWDTCTYTIFAWNNRYYDLPEHLLSSWDTLYTYILAFGIFNCL